MRVQWFQPGRGVVSVLGDAFTQNRFSESVGERGAAQKVERLGKAIDHDEFRLSATEGFGL